MHFFSLKLAHIPEVFFDNVVKRSLLTWLASQSCPSVADLKDDIVVTLKNHQVINARIFAPGLAFKVLRSRLKFVFASYCLLRQT